MIKTLGKVAKDSAVTMTEIVLPSHGNPLGTIFGGHIMSWMDIAAAISAGRHARKVVVTASFDAVHFVAPVKVGQVVHIKAMVNFASRTSMEVGLRVDAEDLATGKFTHTASAYTTFVALAKNGKPSRVPLVLPETPDEKRRYVQAQKRREVRLQLAKKLKNPSH